MQKKILTYPLKVAIAIFLLGTLFKIMHWPGVASLLIMGAGLVIVLYTIRFIVKKEKNIMDLVKFFCVLAATYFYLAKDFHWPSLNYGIYIIDVMGVFWLYEEWGNIFNKGKKGFTNAFYAGVIGVSILLICIGNIFKIMHWPYAYHLIIFGFLGMIIWLLAGDLFKLRATIKDKSYSDIIDDEFIND